MAREFFINGESMVTVKGRSDSPIGTITQLGLADSPITVTPDFRHRDMNVDAWGGEIPVDVQFMLAAVNIRMTLIHFDRAVLDTCLRLSMGAPIVVGALPRAGARLGNSLARFVPGNNYIGLNILSPVAGVPWRFFFTYLTGPPMEFPLGTEKSVVVCNWRAIPYTSDPWGAGLGASGALLWDYVADT